MEKLTGDTFSPLNRSMGTGGTRTGSGGAGADRSTPIQQAIRVLSLRVPKVAGAAAPVAQSLMAAPGGAALGGMNLGALGPAGGASASQAPSASPISGPSPAQPTQGASLGLEDILRKLFGLGSAIPGMVSPGGVLPQAPGAGGWRTVNDNALAGGQPPSAPPPRITIGSQPGAPVATGPEVTTPEPPQVPDHGYPWQQQSEFSPWNQSGAWDKSF